MSVPDCSLLLLPFFRQKMSKRTQPVTYSEVFQFLSNKEQKYASGCSSSRKRAIRKFSENVRLEDGVLFYFHDEGKENKILKNKRRWIHDQQTKQQILNSVHDDPAGGCHFGRDKTRDKVATRYFWHGLFDDVDDYVKTCDKCQKV